jgi:hypothetical protein
MGKNFYELFEAEESLEIRQVSVIREIEWCCRSFVYDSKMYPDNSLSSFSESELKVAFYATPAPLKQVFFTSIS